MIESATEDLRLETLRTLFSEKVPERERRLPYVESGDPLMYLTPFLDAALDVKRTWNTTEADDLIAQIEKIKSEVLHYADHIIACQRALVERLHDLTLTVPATTRYRNLGGGTPHPYGNRFFIDGLHESVAADHLYFSSADMNSSEYLYRFDDRTCDRQNAMAATLHSWAENVAPSYEALERLRRSATRLSDTVREVTDTLRRQHLTEGVRSSRRRRTPTATVA